MSGILAVVIRGLIINDGSISLGFAHLLLEDSLYARSTMIAFILAAVVPILVTWGLSKLINGYVTPVVDKHRQVYLAN